MRMTLVQRVVAAIVGLYGVSLMFYADVAPNLPVIDRHVPAAFIAVGLVGLVAAVGILRRADWGRVLGITFVALVLIIQLPPVIGSSVREGLPDLAELLNWAIYLAILGFILFELLRRWPFPVTPDPPVSGPWNAPGRP